MSLANSVRSLPAMLRVGVLGAIAYRAELFVWLLATTMPLIMLALFSAVAREAPLGRYGEADFVAYFLATFVARQLTGSWAAWEMNQDVRQGTLSLRLLRPVHPLIGYAVENVAAMPFRFAMALPIGLIALFTVGRHQVTRDPWLGLMCVVALLGGWLITLFFNLMIGCLAFFLESSVKVMDVYLAAFFVFSGYLFPVDLFPPGARAVADALPFRYQMGFPVELMTAAYDGHRDVALALLGRQWLFVALGLVGTWALWRRGVRRFNAYGG